MRPQNPSRRHRPNGGSRIMQIGVYLGAIVLGVAAAYLVLSASPFKGGSHDSGGEGYEPGRAGSRAGRLSGASLAAKKEQQEATAEGGSDEDAWFKRLDAVGCAATEELRVCSHRAKSAEISDVVSGSLSAYPALWKAKVKCFDIDVVATSDGQLLASHPDDLQAALPAAKFGKLAETVGRHSLAALREAGADEERYPTVDAVLLVLAKLIEGEEDKFWLKEGGTHLDYSKLPGIFLDLKGSAFSKESVAHISAAAAELKISPHVAVFVSKPEQEAAAKAAGYAGPLIHGYMDKVDPNPALTAEALAPYAMLGPSIHMADPFFKRAKELEKPTHVWTVDVPAALHRALQVGVDSVISNRPLALRKVLFDWRDRCSDQL